MDDKSRQDLRKFCKRRTEIHRRLKNAGLPSTNKQKKPDSDKTLPATARSLQRKGIKLIEVTHIISRAEQERQIHDSIIKRHKANTSKKRESQKAYKKKIDKKSGVT